MNAYTPIDCNLYDRYEAWATRRTPLRIVHRGTEGDEQVAHGIIVDLRNEDGAEWLVLAGGARIRLDRIVYAGPVEQGLA
jgi:hypothetical protein